MKSEMSAKVTVSGYSNNVAELKRVMDTLPENSTFDIHYSKGDRPWESDSFIITFSWQEEV